MNVAVKFFRDCVSGIVIRQKFQFCLLCWFARRRSDALKVRFDHGVGNEDWIHACDVDAGEVGGCV